MPDYDPALLQPNAEVGGPPPPEQKKSGCLKFGVIGCATVLLLAVAFVFAVTFAVFTSMKSSDSYKYALQKAQQSPALQRAIGAPIVADKLVIGHISASGPSGKADIQIPLSGPKGKASLYVKATKEGGKWNYERINAHVDATNEDIDLLIETPAGTDF